MPAFKNHLWINFWRGEKLLNITLNSKLKMLAPLLLECLLRKNIPISSHIFPETPMVQKWLSCITTKILLYSSTARPSYSKLETLSENITCVYVLFFRIWLYTYVVIIPDLSICSDRMQRRTCRACVTQPRCFMGHFLLRRRLVRLLKQHQELQHPRFHSS